MFGTRTALATPCRWGNGSLLRFSNDLVGETADDKRCGKFPGRWALSLSGADVHGKDFEKVSIERYAPDILNRSS